MRKRAYEDVDDMLAKAQKDSKDIRKVDHDNVKRRLSIVRKEVEGIRKQTLEAAKTVRLKVRQDVDVILDHPCSASSKDCKIVVKDSSSSVDEKAPLYSSELNEPTEDGDKDAIRVDEAQNEVEDIGKDVHLDTNKDTANKFGHECEDVCKPINRKTSDINLKANEESKSRGPSSEEKKSDDASVPVICLS